MRILSLGVFAVGVACTAVLAQDRPAPNSPAATPQSTTPSAASTSNQSAPIAPGSVIPVQLTKTVDAKKAKVGDQVEAKVVQDMKSNSGELIVSKDTKVLGHVTEAQARTKDQKESQMGIAFDRTVTKDGHDMTLPMSIQAIIGPQTSNPNSANSENGGGATAATNAPSQSAPSNGNAGGSGRGAPMGGGGGAMPSQPSASVGGGESTGTPRGNNSAPAITGNTQGVVGLPDLTLSSAAQGTNGSVITSDKKNVKLESGTMMLLRVNQANP